jgi:PAS domain S-box-containing protein
MDLRKIRFSYGIRTVVALAVCIVAAVFLTFYVNLKENNKKVYIQNEAQNVSGMLEANVLGKTADIAGILSLNDAVIRSFKIPVSMDNHDTMLALKSVKESSGASIIYLMDASGKVIACTKFTDGATLTGNNYNFRPYFINAMKGENYIYAGMGLITLERGIFFSAPVRDKISGRVKGVLVIKDDMTVIDGIISGIKDPAAFVSPEGVVFASNQKDWLFKALYPADEKKLDDLRRSKQFAYAKIGPLAAKYGFQKDIEYINGVKYYVASHNLNLDGWKIFICGDAAIDMPLTPFQRDIFLMMFAALFAIAVLIWLLYANSRTKLALFDSEIKYREIFDSANDAILIHDIRTGRIIDANIKARKMLDLTEENMKKKPYGGESAYENSYDLEEAFAAEDGSKENLPRIFEWKAKDKNGNRFWTEVSVKTAVLSGEKVIISVVRDINERKLSEYKLENLVTELKRSNAELQDFAHVASHDMKEPLRMVSSYVALIKRRYKGKLDSDADEFIDFAETGAKHMQNIIDDLLAFSRVSTQGAEFTETDTAEILKQLMISFKFKIEDKKAVIFTENMPKIKADSSQIEQLFTNLISNALKFSKESEPAKIDITAEKKDNEWIFSVKDNGIGIETQYFGKIFVIFQKLHPKDQYEGSGVGLAICKKIVERHGGRIWVESEPGKGSTFFFTIPA